VSSGPRCRVLFLNRGKDSGPVVTGANIGLATVRRFENGVHTMHGNNMLAVMRAFEEAGVIFTQPTGSRVRTRRMILGMSQATLGRRYVV
jgi:hypothetical protein